MQFPGIIAGRNRCRNHLWHWMHAQCAWMCARVYACLYRRSARARRCLNPWPTWTTESQIVVDIPRRISSLSSLTALMRRLRLHGICSAKRYIGASHRISHTSKIKLYWPFEENVTSLDLAACTTNSDSSTFCVTLCRKKLFLFRKTWNRVARSRKSTYCFLW